MFNVPSLTAAWVVGGLIHLCWCKHFKDKEDALILLASGLMLGEGGVELVLIPFRLALKLESKGLRSDSGVGKFRTNRTVGKSSFSTENDPT
jgi:hypothetical protein